MKILYKTYDARQIRAKQIELESKTGLKWDFYHIGDGYVIKPVITRETPMNENAAQALLPWLDKEYRSFTALSEKSGISLADVVSGAKTLVQTQRAVPTVGRCGGCNGIRKA